MNDFKLLNKNERPDEKCLLYGPQALTDQELLSILLRTGTKTQSVLEVAAETLKVNPQFDGLVGLMHHSIAELSGVNGIGQKKAIQLTVVGEISRRIWNRSKRIQNQQFQSAQTVADYYKEDLRYLTHEEVYIMLLDGQMRLLKDFHASKGCSSQTVVSAREILMEALRVGAVGLIMVHNHPGGNPNPSQDDVAFTKNLQLGASLVGLNLLDHVVIGDNSYYSFKEQELI